jgi:FtsZ-interacting cell division protein YlmF
MNEERYILYDNYLHNELTAEEKAAFENQLQNDPEVAASFEIYKDLNVHLENKLGNQIELNSFKENLKTISKQNFTKQKSKVITFRPWQYAVAASITILLGTWLFTQNSNPEYGSYNQHENAYFTERNSADNNLKNAQEAFNDKNYAAAVMAFEKILEPKTPELNYFYAIALIETNNYAKAETVLNDLKSGTSVYAPKAIWYLALSNLKQQKLDVCKMYLKQISEDTEDFDKAQKLLEELE